MTSPCVSETVASFVRWCEQRYRPTTIALYSHYLNRFCVDHGSRPLIEITRLDIETHSTKKHPLEVLRRFFRWCVDVAELLARSPCQGIYIPKSGRRSRLIARREAVTLRRRSSEALRKFLLAAEESGARPHEVRGFRVQDIASAKKDTWNVDDLRSGECYFRLDQYKGQGRRINPYLPRIIPISPRLGRLIGRILSRPIPADGIILRSATGKPWTRDALRCAFRRIQKKLSSPGKDAKSRVVIYSYRHTLATRLAKQGVNGRLLADFLGHSTLDLLGWYVHPSTMDLCDLLKRPRRDGK